jgi:tetratricopeptide (TPR) repeat protein
VSRPEEPLERLSARGAELLATGRPFDAVEVLRHAVAAGERAAPDLLVRAYLRTRSWHSCVRWLGPLVERGHVRFAGALGVALVQVGERGRAEEALRLAVGSGDVACANDLAILLRDEGRLQEAVQVLQRAAAAGDGQAAANLVAVLVEAGDLRAAIAAAEQHADPARPDTLVALADVRAEARRDDEAEELYRRARDGRAVRAHSAYGAFLWSVRGDTAAAEREFRAAAECEEPGWAGTLARFLLDEGRGDEARSCLERAAAEGDPEAALLLAELDGEDPTDD